MTRALNVTKLITILAFMVTLSGTYYLRSEVLTLNKIRFSAYNIGADDKLRRMSESHPARMAEYEIQMQHYQLQMEHYNDMLGLYHEDYDAYVQRLEDKFQPPSLPRRPAEPQSPELSDKLGKINAEFTARQYDYFASTSRLNWITCVSALLLVGGLLFLTMFETGTQRLHSTRTARGRWRSPSPGASSARPRRRTRGRWYGFRPRPATGGAWASSASSGRARRRRAAHRCHGARRASSLSC